MFALIALHLSALVAPCPGIPRMAFPGYAPGRFDIYYTPPPPLAPRRFWATCASRVQMGFLRREIAIQSSCAVSRARFSSMDSPSAQHCRVNDTANNVRSCLSLSRNSSAAPNAGRSNDQYTMKHQYLQEKKPALRRGSGSNDSWRRR